MKAQYDFEAKAKAVHGDRYDYSSTTFTGVRDKVIIVCPEHGEFTQKAANHLSGSGCRKCYARSNASRMVQASATAKRKAASTFVSKARVMHGNRYDYTNTQYNGACGLVSIGCSVHGQFEQRAYTHLRGAGCPACGKARVESRLTLEQFAEKARAVHGGRYEYIGVETDRYGKTGIALIRCATHGEFKQAVSKHLYAKRGCPECYKTGHVYDLESFIMRAALVHGSRYDYSSSQYGGATTPLSIICGKHGPFNQTPHVHLRLGKGAGCPRCHDEECTSSVQEVALRDWLATLTEVRPNDRTILKHYEIDIWLPAHRVGVEFHGLYWHSEKHKPKRFHQQKRTAAAAAEVSLIQIFEDEWRLKPDLVKSVVLAKIGMSPHRVFARKCSVVSVPYKDGRSFYETNHLQGADSSQAYYGLRESERLVACLSVTYSGTTAKIQRFASLAFHSVPGGFSRLLKAFLRDHSEIRRVETYANLRYSDGKVYEANGFMPAGITAPGYFYVRMKTNPVREPRQRYQLHKLKKSGHIGTERSITAAMKLVRVYDAGHARFVLAL